MYVSIPKCLFMAFLHNSLKGCPCKAKEMAYIAIDWSVLEYHAPIWDPYLKEDISKIEKLHCQAARFVSADHQRTSSVTKMLKDLGWTNLAGRRRDLRLALLFKIVKQKVVVSADTSNLKL